jgi:hypothetical protein
LAVANASGPVFPFLPFFTFIRKTDKTTPSA